MKNIAKLSVVLATMSIFACKSEPQSSAAVQAIEPDSIQTVSIEEPVEPQVVFGIELKDLKRVDATIGAGESLGAILNNYGVSFATIDELAKKSKEVFDVRRLQRDKPYTVLCKEDSILRAQYFIYQPNPIEYIVFDLIDSVQVYRGEKPVEVRIETASGVIESSLYESLTQANLSRALAVEMNNIYAWTIDFFRIQKGDKFKLIYEAKYVDNEFVGIGIIRAANFNHYDEDYYAFYYEENELFGDYYDEKGMSLRRAFLRAPVNYTRISSRYSGRRFHPVLKRWKSHLGTDYAAPTGTPIFATANGTITEARYKRNNGNYVKVKHNSTYTTQYLHMSKIASGIRPGVRVKQGQIIGYVGSTGLATGPHVCYRFWKNGVQVDPYKQKLPAAEPIKEENLADYTQKMEGVKEKLDLIPWGPEDPIL